MVLAILRFFSLAPFAPQSAQRNSDQAGNQAKITQLKDDQEELHTKLEKERDLYESYMYELLAEEENIALFVKEYVKHQELYFTSVLREIQHTMRSMDGLFRKFAVCSLLPASFYSCATVFFAILPFLFPRSQ